VTKDYFKRLELPIVAPATALGGPLIVLRVSGKNLSPLLSDFQLSTEDARKAKYCDIYNIDKAIVLYFKGPHSFTGEDVLELQIHGSLRLCESILEELKKRNVVEALPGEFSFRAFANDKISLQEAEALNLALSEASESSVAQGLLTLSENTKLNTEKLFNLLKSSLCSARGRLESAIDFSEAAQEQKEDVTQTATLLNSLLQACDKFLTHYENYSQSFTTPRVLIVGEPNVGKSTLLNLLMGEERVLVSEKAGTTRDYVEVPVRIRNRKIIFIDSAGIRGLEGTAEESLVEDIEARGIKLALNLIESAHAIIWVQSSNKEKNKNLEKLLNNNSKVFELLSFGDLSKNPQALDLRNESQRLRDFIHKDVLSFLLKEEESFQDKEECFLSQRQSKLVEAFREHIFRAATLLEEGEVLDLAAEELKLADEALKKCCGEELSEDYISEIFSQFCLGK
jgi:tRNA modification GTPase